MYIKHLFKALLGFIVAVNCYLAHAEPMLNGIGVHQELGQDVFIGALFSNSLSNDSGTLLRSTEAMRMELKIVTPDGITARRFSNLWIEGIAVNSKADELRAQADNTVIFDGLFKGRLQKDDHIVISNTPGRGVTVSVNKIELGTIKDEKFFSLLLATWIGGVPLSSNYKDSLLKVGDIPASLRSRFSNITYAANRTADVASWTNKSEPAEEPKPVVEAKAEPISSAKTASVASAKVEAPKVVIPPIDKPTLAIPLPSVTPDVIAPSGAAASIAAAPAEVDDEEGPALTAQTLLARQFYVSDAIKKIRTKTRYPQRSLERGQEGNVRMSVIIDRKGTLLDIRITDMSEHELLNKEAQDAVKRAAPFSALPDEISGNRFEFSVPMRWSLPK